MSYQNSIFLSITFLMFFSLNVNGQINPTKPAKKRESNGLSTSPVPKNIQDLNLGHDQRKETIAKMEKDEKDLSDLATSGDGRISKSENAVLNNIRTLKESLKQ